MQEPSYEQLKRTLEEQEKTISALRQNETMYRNLFDHMKEEVHLWKLVRDARGAIRTWALVDVNPAALKSWGKTRAEAIGKTTDEIFPSANATAHFMPIVQRIFSENKPHSWESYFPGTKQHLKMTSVPFGDYFITTGVDITAIKESELNVLDANRELALMNSFMIDREMRIIELKKEVNALLHKAGQPHRYPDGLPDGQRT